MDDFEKGIKTTVGQCMDVTSKDRVLIVADTPSKRIGLALKKEALTKTPYVRFFDLDMPAYGGRPLKTMPSNLMESLDDVSVTFFLAAPKEGELKTVREPFIQKVISRARHAHMVGVTEAIIKSGMCADYSKVESITMNMYDILKNAKEVSVKSPAGTDFRATFDSSMHWIPCTGICRKAGEWDNLPSGEVFTAPDSLEGRVVVDGSMGEWIEEKYSGVVDYRSSPLIIEIEAGDDGSYMTSANCRNADLLKDFKAYVGEEKCASRVGELGFGTNVFLKDFIGNMLQDEKFPGVHIALGDPYHEKTGANWVCGHHIDLVMRGCDVWVDEKQIMKSGKYLHFSQV